jgi:hypothetical protein
MIKRFVVPSILASLVLAGCKDKAGEGKAQSAADDKSSEGGGIGETPEAAPIDAQGIAKLSEHATSIFEAASNTAQPLHWELKGEQIALRAETNLVAGKTATYNAKIFAQIKESEETELFACKGLNASASGRADLVLRGDKLHVLCVNSAQEEDPGSTDAARFAFDLGKRVIEPAGTYGGDGSLDLDTIDLDETE